MKKNTILKDAPGTDTDYPGSRRAYWGWSMR